MSVLAILVLALLLAVAGGVVRFAVRIALLSLLIALVINYDAHVAASQRSRVAKDPGGDPTTQTPLIVRSKR